MEMLPTTNKRMKSCKISYETQNLFRCCFMKLESNSDVWQYYDSSHLELDPFDHEDIADKFSNLAYLGLSKTIKLISHWSIYIYKDRSQNVRNEIPYHEHSKAGYLHLCNCDTSLLHNEFYLHEMVNNKSNSPYHIKFR